MLATPSAFDARSGGRRRLAVLFGLLLAAVAVTGFGGGPLRAATVEGQRASTQIAFASKRDGHDQVYLVDPDGSKLRRLTHNRATDTNPAWSPGGQRIAFESDRGGTEDIYVMNADGSHQQRLTRSHAFDGRPNWSPDGTRIAFTHGNYIDVMNANGSGLRQLTKGPSSGVEDDHPAWSPDGTTIAFDRSSVAGPPSEIYVIHADGSGMHRLTRISHFSLTPAWSPDGRRIAFASGRGGISNIYVMRSNGTRVLKLTRSGGDSPAWSPSGHKLAFASDRQEVFHHEIYVMNSDGSGQRRLTRGAAVDSAVLSWR